MKFMVGALIASTIFFSSYLYYHFNAEPVPYLGEGIMRVIYYAILVTHIPLAVLMVPFIIWAVCLAIKGNIEKHRKIVRYLWPVWMYVSVTGVMIYLFLYT